MSDTPDPQIVRDFARRAILSSAEDVDYIGIGEQFSDDENWPTENDAFDAMLEAVEAERQKAIITVSWPDEQPETHRCAEPDVHALGTAAYRRVADAASDAEAVAWATSDMSAMVQGWADACENRRRELWTQAAHANDALYERFRDRIEALPTSKAGAK